MIYITMLLTLALLIAIARIHYLSNKVESVYADFWDLDGEFYDLEYDYHQLQQKYRMLELRLDNHVEYNPVELPFDDTDLSATVKPIFFDHSGNGLVATKEQKTESDVYTDIKVSMGALQRFAMVKDKLNFDYKKSAKSIVKFIRQNESVLNSDILVKMITQKFS